MFARALTMTAIAAAVMASPAAARDPIVGLAQVHAGMACTAKTVVHGTDISEFGVQVIDVLDDVDGMGPRVLVRVTGDAVRESGIASGFSGSPVYCQGADGTVGNIGAISATIGQFGNDVGLVTPIEQMLDLPVKPPSGARHPSRAVAASVKPLATPLTFSGLSPALGRLVERAGKASGRAYVAGPVGPLGSFAPQPLVPGTSLAASYSTGALALSAIGTVTYRDGDTVYGFGHQFDGAGRRALVLQDAYVYDVIDNPNVSDEESSYKLASPGHTLGIVSNDATSAIVGTVGERAPTTPVTVSVRDVDRGRTVRQVTNVADEATVGDPLGHGLLPTVAPMAVAQAVTAAFDGAPARETGRLCLTTTLVGVKRALRFCDRYVVNGEDTAGVPGLAMTMANDVTSALSVIDGADYKALRVRSVRAAVEISRGEALATLLSVRGPRTARRGHKARLKLRVRETQGPALTLPVTVTVPRDAPLGRATLTLSGRGLDDASDGDDTITILLGGGGSSGGSAGAESFRAVQSGYDRAARYDGLTGRIGKTRWHAARDSRLRIGGRAAVALRVTR